ncbi:MAG: shikimate kinase [Novosphingobium sp.]|nr:shikimate kinase [Novosphingobium sp.]
MTNDGSTLSDIEIARIAERIDRPVVLVGMMGVGKSSVGRRMATMLHVPFVDADDAIEEAAKMPISEIFEHYGEASFRDGERRVIARLMEGAKGVIATGGGAFCDPETRALILDKGIAVWLDADVDTLVDRVSRKDTRPLLRNGNPREILTRLRAEREPAYSQAPIHIISKTGPHQVTISNILQAIDSWL